jgi:transcription termination factor 2
MFAFQDDAVDWMKIRELDKRVPGGFLCHEMGLGKTRMMCRLIKESIVPRTLVLTTKSTLGGWFAELREQSKFEFDVVEYASGKFSRPLDTARPAVIVGTHYSVLKGFPFAVDRIVIDEAHVMRNKHSGLYTAFVGIVSRLRWGMTATPYNNRSSDISSYTGFLCRKLPAEAFKYFMLRKTRAEVFTHGPVLKVDKHVYEFETAEEKRLYDFVDGQIDRVEEWMHANRGRMPRHLLSAIGSSLQIRKRQAAIHPQIVLDAEKVWRRNMGEEELLDDWKFNVTKFKHILEMVRKDQSEGKSTMIVTHFERELQLLHENLTAAGIPVEILNGKTRPKERRELELIQTTADIVDVLKKSCVGMVAEKIASFVAPPRVVLLQIKAGGVGLSLPWIHHVINTSPDWNPFMELQAMYRAYRITTKHDVRVTNMYFNKTIDTHIQNTQSTKLKESLKWTGDIPESISDFISMPIV